MTAALDIEHRIARLQKLKRSDLVTELESLYDQNAPNNISQNLLIRSIAYKLQEQELGGLPAADQKLLDRMTVAFMKDPSTLKTSMQIKTGTRLRRLYQGKVHEVTATADGFLYESTKYNSLSEVARAITNTRWNGLVFFGLKQKGKIVHD